VNHSEEPAFENDDKIRGVPGTVLLQFAGTIPKDDLLIMQAVIEEAREQVDDDDLEFPELP